MCILLPWKCFIKWYIPVPDRQPVAVLVWVPDREHRLSGIKLLVMFMEWCMSLCMCVPKCECVCVMWCLSACVRYTFLPYPILFQLHSTKQNKTN